MEEIFKKQPTTPMSTTAVDLEEWSKGFKQTYSKPKNFFYSVEMKDLMGDAYSDVLQELAHTPNAEINVQVHWNLSSKTDKQAAFRTLMRKVFTDDGDHNFFDKLMKNKSTIIVSIQVYNTVTKSKEIIGFVSLTKINDGRDTK